MKALSVVVGIGLLAAVGVLGYMVMSLREDITTLRADIEYQQAGIASLSSRMPAYDLEALKNWQAMVEGFFRQQEGYNKQLADSINRRNNFVSPCPDTVSFHSFDIAVRKAMGC